MRPNSLPNQKRYGLESGCELRLSNELIALEMHGDLLARHLTVVSGVEAT